MHDQNLEKKGKTSIGIDELITLLYNTNLPVWWVGRSEEPVLVFLHSFLWRKLFLISLFFVHYRVIKLWFFWGNYFWSNFSSLDGLFYLFMVYSYFIMIMNQQNKGTFSNDTCSSTSLYITLHEVSMNFFFLNTFSFFLGLFYWATRFLSFDSRIFCHLLANLSPNFWLFLVLFRMAGTLVIMSKPYHVPHVSRITTNGKSFTETIFNVSNEMNPTFVTCFLVNEL